MTELSPTEQTGVGKSKVSLNGLIPLKEKTPDVFPIESYKVGDKLTIEAIPLEFNPKDVLTKHGESLATTISQSDGVIFEYFPEEFEKMRNNPLVRLATNYNRFKPYYSFASQEALSHHKDAYVCDPAHDESFALFRLGGGKITGIAQALEKARNQPTKGHSLIETNFRRIIIARGIQNLSNALDTDSNASPKKLLLLYPPVHWKGIKQYLDNPKDLDKAFDGTLVFKKGPLKESYFSMRRYTPTDGTWKLAQKTEIL